MLREPRLQVLPRATLLTILLLLAIPVATLHLVEAAHTLTLMDTGVELRLGKGVRVFCATEISENIVLVAGSTGSGSNPVPYAILVNLESGSATPVSIPTPHGVKGEVLYCKSLAGYTILVGYVAVPGTNKVNLTVWLLYPNGTTRVIVTPLLGVPLSIYASSDGLVATIACFYGGECSESSHVPLVIYDVQGGFNAIVKRVFTASYIATRRLAGLGRVSCIYPFGVVKLLNGSIAVIAYVVNYTGGFRSVYGVLALLNPGEVIPRATLIPLYPFAYSHYSSGIIVAGVTMPPNSTVGVLALSYDGSFRITRLRIEGVRLHGIPHVTSASCQGNVCIITANWGVPLVNILVLNGTRVVDAYTVRLSNLFNVTFSHLDPHGRVVIVGFDKDGYEVLRVYRITGAEEIATVATNQQPGINGITLLLIALALGAATASILLSLNKLRSRRGS